MFIEVNDQALNVRHIHSITKCITGLDKKPAISYQLPFELICEQFIDEDTRDKKYNEIMLMNGAVR